VLCPGWGEGGLSKEYPHAVRIFEYLPEGKTLGDMMAFSIALNTLTSTERSYWQETWTKITNQF
jgi:hypothetical protein